MIRLWEQGIWKQELLVHFSSAQRLAGGNSYKVEDANHMEVCKPTGQDHTSYILLLGRVIEVSLNNQASFMFHCD